MPRRRRTRQPRSSADSVHNAPCSISALPVEILAQIVLNLRVNQTLIPRMSRDSACDLSSAARVSHLFCELAMPLLWERVELWPDRQPGRSLGRYPAIASEHTLSYIRTMSLSVYKESNDLSMADFNDLYTYMCGCFRILGQARSIQRMKLFLGVYDPNSYPSECREVIEEINRTAFRILKHVEKMDLQELSFCPGRQTARIEDIMTIIERKVHKLDIFLIPLGSWAHRLQYHKRMTSIEVAYAEPRDAQTEAIFWTAISQLPNVTTVKVDDVLLSPALNLQFPHIVSLQYFLWDIPEHEWTHSFDAIFNQMPGLETLDLMTLSWPEFQLAVENLSISSIACRNLKTIFLGSCLPKGLLSTLARDCANLTKCNYHSHNVDDEDLRQLSRCQNICSLSLNLSTEVTTGLTYLTHFPRLHTLDLHYSAGKHIDKQLLLDFVSSCPDLKSIVISDRSSSTRRNSERPFETTDVADLFAAGVELRSYIEPQYSEDRLINYVIRIDKLREDVLQLHQLMGRMGVTLTCDLVKDHLESQVHRLNNQLHHTTINDPEDQ